MKQKMWKENITPTHMRESFSKERKRKHMYMTLALKKRKRKVVA
jgi:hypothetical protein